VASMRVVFWVVDVDAMQILVSFLFLLVLPVKNCVYSCDFKSIILFSL